MLCRSYNIPAVSATARDRPLSRPRGRPGHGHSPCVVLSRVVAGSLPVLLPVFRLTLKAGHQHRWPAPRLLAHRNRYTRLAVHAADP